MNRTTPLSALVFVGTWFAVQSCVTDNPAAYENILGPTRAEPSSGGSSGAGSGTGGTAGVPTGGTGAITGGTTSGGDGGMGEGGDATGGTGKGGTAGSGGTIVNPPPHPDFLPPCFLGPTQAGDEIVKGAPCTAADPQLCYRPCGPNQSGWKEEKCVASVYTEGDCRFPLDGDFSCYRIPDDIDEGVCGVTEPPTATAPCDVAQCTVCNFDGFYSDSAGDAKEGYCVCRDPDEMGVRRWTCASTTAWPCPVSSGC